MVTNMNEIHLSADDLISIQKIMDEYNKDSCTLVNTPTGIGFILEVHLDMGKQRF